MSEKTEKEPWLKLGVEPVVYSAKEYLEGKWLHCPWLSALKLTGDEWIVSMPSPPFAFGGIDAIFIDKGKAEEYIALRQPPSKEQVEIERLRRNNSYLEIMYQNLIDHMAKQVSLSPPMPIPAPPEKKES